MEITRPVIHWFRKDLRLMDNPSLSNAAESGHPVLAVYILEDGSSDPWALGSAARWWLHHSLTALDKSLKAVGNRLILRRGRPREVLKDLVIETGAKAVYSTRLTEPHAVKVDSEVTDTLDKLGVGFRLFYGNLLFPPKSITTKKGDPFKMFTPFYKACMKELPLSPSLHIPKKLTGLRKSVKSDLLDQWKLLPTKPDWSAGWLDKWTPGEQGALLRLDSFLENSAMVYETQRNRPDIEGTSKLSPHLSFGEISAKTCWNRFSRNSELSSEKDIESFFRQIIWREFSQHLLYHWPTFPEKPFREEFERFPWTRDKEALSLWQKGLTGYPIVDAGMRELWATGWMHNRVRMIAASFLVKHLLIPWQDGASWFWDTLVDADLANNSVSWQWIAGCGVDAAPFFRIFNPIVQGQKFDQNGIYVRHWVPELANLPNSYIHQPWTAPRHMLEDLGISLGKSYPYPLVNHSSARNRILSLFNDYVKVPSSFLKA